ncbi:MAG: hypothetical protein HRT71_10290 [Flavobacteriales bacterium]|nr:hypothetical protein [Flavobacteriales bacterium]
MKSICIVLLIWGLFTPLSGYAHGNLSDRINNLTAEISKDSTSFKLFYDRGLLYQYHKEFDNALSDYVKSKALGNKSDVLQHRLAEVYFAQNKFGLALQASKEYKDISDVKIRKLQAQILMKLNRFSEALSNYDYVVKNIVDIRPGDIIEYSEIFLFIDSTNYTGAIRAIDIGLDRLGSKVITLRTKKIEYLIKSGQSKKVIEEYDSVIEEQTRKEFWTFKKALYLFDIKNIAACKKATGQVDASIALLSMRFQNTPGIKKLQTDLNKLKTKITDEN